MLNLEDLEQLAAFKRAGTLSKAAEELHISQPSITRAMRRVEEAFGAELFVRGKNRIALNETGELAAGEAGRLLSEAEAAVKRVREFDRSLRTVTVGSCAPAPLWYVLPALSAAFPEQNIASSLKGLPELSADFAAGAFRAAVFPAPVTDENYVSIPFLREQLYVSVPPQHALAQYATVTLEQMNGFNYLLRSAIGFWDALCREWMPASRFLVQTDEFEFAELVRESTLPCFVTDLSLENSRELLRGRRDVPITDPEACVTYYFVCRKKERELRRAAERLRSFLGKGGEKE